jgi:hypothetical protein
MGQLTEAERLSAYPLLVKVTLKDGEAYDWDLKRYREAVRLGVSVWVKMCNGPPDTILDYLNGEPWDAFQASWPSLERSRLSAVSTSPLSVDDSIEQVKQGNDEADNLMALNDDHLDTIDEGIQDDTMDQDYDDGWGLLAR